jgi:hypothetical protein
MEILECGDLAARTPIRRIARLLERQVLPWLRAIGHIIAVESIHPLGRAWISALIAQATQVLP